VELAAQLRAIGTTKFSGRAGDSSTNVQNGGAGGGGAAGPNGDGKAGATSSQNTGSSGGGAGGGSATAGSDDSGGTLSFSGSNPLSRIASAAISKLVTVSLVRIAS
jgi:hypothetical protein